MYRLYCISLSILQICTYMADTVQIFGKFWGTQYIANFLLSVCIFVWFSIYTIVCFLIRELFRPMEVFQCLCSKNKKKKNFFIKPILFLT